MANVKSNFLLSKVSRTGSFFVSFDQNGVIELGPIFFIDLYPYLRPISMLTYRILNIFVSAFNGYEKQDLHTANIFAVDNSMMYFGCTFDN